MDDIKKDPFEEFGGTVEKSQEKTYNEKQPCGYIRIAMKKSRGDLSAQDIFWKTSRRNI